MTKLKDKIVKFEKKNKIKIEEFKVYGRIVILLIIFWLIGYFIGKVIF